MAQQGASFVRRRQRAAALAGLGALAMSAGCSSSAPAPSSDVPVGGGAAMFTNPAESRLYEVSDGAGGIITAFGERDPAGLPTSLTMLYGQDAAQAANGTGTWLHLDGQERVSRILGADGTVINLSWQNETSVGVSARTADGAAQVDTALDLASSVPGTPAVERGAPRAEVIAPGAFSSPPRAATSSIAEALSTEPRPAAAAADAQQYALIIVDVLRCGARLADDWVQSVVVTITNAPKGAVNQYPATRMGSGLFAARIPLVKTSEPAGGGKPALEPICKALAPLAVEICNSEADAKRIKERLCGKMAAKLDADHLAGPGAPITKACNDGFGMVIKHCSMIGWVGALARDSVSQFICEKISKAIDSAVQMSGPVMVRADAAVLGDTMSSDVIDVSAALAASGGGQARVNIDRGENCCSPPLITCPRTNGTSWCCYAGTHCGMGDNMGLCTQCPSERPVWCAVRSGMCCTPGQKCGVDGCAW